MALDDYFVWGNGGARMTPEEIAQQRLLLAKNSKIDTSPVASWTQGAARVADALAGAFQRGAIDRAAKANDADSAGLRSDFMPSLYGSPSVAEAAAGTAPAAAGGVPVAATGTVDPGAPNDIQNQFLDTVKTGYDPGTGQKVAVTNPYGLAAIAATGQAESGYSPQNAGGTWADGKNPAGGIMSWNGPRLANLQKFAGGNNGTPQQQGQFFLQENPDLITALNGAKSVDEAQHLMNNAWAFKGYDQPGNPNAAHRLALAQGYLPRFAGQQPAAGGGAPTQVASLDPSAGMTAPANASQAIQQQSPTTSYVDPAVATAYAQPAAAPAQGQPPQGTAIPVPTPRPDPAAQAPLDPATASPDLMMSALGIQPDQASQPTSSGQALAAAVTSRTPAAPVSPAAATVADALKAVPPSAPPAGVGLAQSPKQNAALIKALTSPYVDEGTRRLATIVYQKQQAQQQQQQQFVLDQKKAAYEQQLKQADPVYQQTLRKAQYENDHLGQVSPDTQATLAAAEKKAKLDADNAWIQTEHEQDVKSKAPITPTDQARLDLDRQKFEAETKKGQWQKLTDGRLYNETSGEFRDAPPPVMGSTPMKPDDVSGIRKEIQQLPSYKNLSQAAPIYKSMMETSGRDSKASDLNLVYGLGKIMDPTSVVREGEMVMVKNTASLPDWLVGAANSLNGGAALQPETRKAIMREAYGRVTGYNNEFKQDMGQYHGIAKRYNINPDDIIPATDDFQDPEAGAPITQGGPVPIKSVEDYNGLPKGTQYLDPNGKLRVKN
jgi:hypothetical protein